MSTRPAATAARTAPEPDEAELAARLRIAVGGLMRWLRQRDPGSLSPAQLSALISVEAHGPLRIGDLAARERVSAPTMTRLVDVLAEARLVERRPDPEDGRGQLVELSATAVALLADIRRERTTLLVRRLNALAPEDRAALIAALPALEALREG
jgi:DNA-binding MarR family transcriptional regulator